MLVYQTGLYFKLLKTEGGGNTARACKEAIVNIQAAIEMKRKSESFRKNNDAGFTQVITSLKPLTN